MNYRHRVLFSLFSILFSVAIEASERFKGVDLWLPTAYQKQYSTLLEAAEKAKSDPYCFTLLSGRIVESTSTIPHPQFSFRCRTQDRNTFSIQVDGNTLVATNTYGEKQQRIEAAILAEEERKQREKEEKYNLIKQQENIEAAKVLAAKVAARRKEQSQYWTICRKVMRKRLRTFDEVTILTESLPEPTIQADQLTYTVLFDSLSPSKKPLHFQIICTISALDYYRVEIKARKGA